MAWRWSSPAGGISDIDLEGSGVTATIIDGKAIAAEVREEVAERVQKLAARGVTPGFVDLLVGDDPASATYVRMKNKAATEAGMRAFEHDLLANASLDQALELIDRFNADPSIHGAMVQGPMPPGSPIDILDLQRAILPEKWERESWVQQMANATALVVAFMNADGALARRALHDLYAEPRRASMIPHFFDVKSAALAAGAFGCSISGSGPTIFAIAETSLSSKGPGLNATVTLCHTGTKDLTVETLRAEILVVASGRARSITGDMVAPGAVVIDVGINRGDDGKLVGDVDFDQVSKVASAITPVPGGVGPMTVAMLMQNVVLAAESATA